MNKKLHFISISLCSIVLSSIAQTGPGGVTANLRGWYRAGNVTLTAGKVSSWLDQSTLGNNFTNGTASERPTVSASVYNYNPALVFDGNSSNLSTTTDLMASATSSLTIFAVANLDGTSQDTWGTVFEGQGDATWNGGGYGLAALSAGNTTFGCFVRDWDAEYVSVSTATSPISKGSIMTGVWNGGANLGKVDYRWNGTSQGVNAFAGTVGDKGNSTIGGAPTNQYNFYGKIAEIAVYNTGLSTANINKIESYLAIKYGITLGGNGAAGSALTSSAGTTIWNSGTGYHNDLTVIGAESTEGLQQNISSSLNVPNTAGANDMPFTIAHDNISAPSNIGDGTYIAVGHNNGTLKGIVINFTHGITPIEVIQNRIYRIQTTGLAGGRSVMAMTNLEVQFDMTKVPGNGGALGLGAPNATASLRLLLDDNATFGQGGGFERAYSNSGVAGNVIKFKIPVADLPINGVYYFRLGSVSYVNAPLPIELLSFDAKPNGGQVDLNWLTATEINNDFFTIEKTKDGVDFETASIINGAGNSASKINYSSVDNSPFEGVSYYRLKQTDYNGQYTYSSLVRVNFNPDNVFSFDVYPNPNDGEEIKLAVKAGEGEEVLVVVYDITGKESYSKIIIKESNGDSVFAIDPSNKLSPGIYVITASSQQKIYSKRLIVK